MRVEGGDEEELGSSSDGGGVSGKDEELGVEGSAG